ncbi:MAG TPA: hypothetical protein VGM54_24835 [Chthoniobacter sp.]|jgi:hypothetical protein
MNRFLIPVAFLALVSTSFAELRVPANTAYLDPDPNGAKVSKEGISGWTNPQNTVSWFGEIKNPGMLDATVVVSAPRGIDSRFRLTVAGQSQDGHTGAAGNGKPAKSSIGRQPIVRQICNCPQPPQIKIDCHEPLHAVPGALG